LKNEGLFSSCIALSSTELAPFYDSFFLSAFHCLDNISEFQCFGLSITEKTICRNVQLLYQTNFTLISLLSKGSILSSSRAPYIVQRKHRYLLQFFKIICYVKIVVSLYWCFVTELTFTDVFFIMFVVPWNKFNQINYYYLLLWSDPEQFITYFFYLEEICLRVVSFHIAHFTYKLISTTFNGFSVFQGSSMDRDIGLTAGVNWSLGFLLGT
jgi:hypothetical protein